MKKFFGSIGQGIVFCFAPAIDQARYKIFKYCTSEQGYMEFACIKALRKYNIDAIVEPPPAGPEAKDTPLRIYFNKNGYYAEITTSHLLPSERVPTIEIDIYKSQPGLHWTPHQLKRLTFGKRVVMADNQTRMNKIFSEVAAQPPLPYRLPSKEVSPSAPASTICLAI